MKDKKLFLFFTVPSGTIARNMQNIKKARDSHSEKG